MGVNVTTQFYDDEYRKILESFLEGFTLGKDNLACGVFYAGNFSWKARKYNGTVGFYLETASKTFYDALDRKKSWDKVKEELIKTSKEFIKTLQEDSDDWKTPILEHAEESKGEGEKKVKVSKEKKFAIFSLKPTYKKVGEEVFSMCYVDRDFREEIEEIVKKLKEITEDASQDEKSNAHSQAKKKFSLLSLKATKIVLKEKLEKERDQEVLDFYDLLTNAIDLLLQGEENLKCLLGRLLKLKVDSYFGFSEEETNDDAEIKNYTYKPIISSLGYFPSPLSEEEVLKRIGECLFKDWNELYEEDPEKAIQKVREELSLLKEDLGSDPNYWISKLNGKDKEEFSRKLRESLSAIPKGELDSVKKVSFVKETQTPINSATREYYLKGGQKNVEKIVLLFISDLEYEEVKDGINSFFGVLRKSRYLGNDFKAKVDNYRFVPIEKVFPDWEKLKESEKSQWRVQGEKVLAFLLQLGALAKALVRYLEDKGVLVIPIFVLDVGEEGETLPIWDVARAFYNHAFPIPAQTIKKDTLEKLANLSKQKKWMEVESIVKNAFLSAISPKKVLKLVFDKSLNTSIKKIYVIVENETRRIKREDGRPNRIYNVYSIELAKGNEFQIEHTDDYYVFADGKSGDADEFQRFLDDELEKEGVAVICISTDENSWIFEKEALRYYPVLYEDVKVLIDPKKGKEKDAYFIFEKNFQPFLRHVGYKRFSEKSSEGFSLIGIKSPIVFPKELENEPYAHSILSLFFVKNLKGESPVNQEVITYALLSWLAFLTESYLYGFAKPKFMQKKLLKFSFSRKVKEQAYTPKLDSGMLITELAFLVRRSLRGKLVNYPE